MSHTHSIIVNDVMTHPLQTVGMDDSIRTIRNIFETNHYHHLIVHGDHNECVGVISDRDLLKNISPFIGKMGERTADRSLLERRAHQIMTRQLIAVRPNTALKAAARVMLDHRISCLPVVDHKGSCVGIVTLRDVVRWAVEELDYPCGSASKRAA
ncbi:MAG: CBS domain-containing protein [Phycisphaerales bacterium]|jgi:acetoin utilization protein AcuB|tara:strand:+ start:877 stop:1341 length:465 start_codon:yes stop_codon:yes gene_type:complete